MNQLNHSDVNYICNVCKSVYRNHIFSIFNFIQLMLQSIEHKKLNSQLIVNRILAEGFYYQYCRNLLKIISWYQFWMVNYKILVKLCLLWKANDFFPFSYKHPFSFSSVDAFLHWKLSFVVVIVTLLLLKSTLKFKMHICYTPVYHKSLLEFKNVLAILL